MDFEKVVHLGYQVKSSTHVHVFCSIRFKEGCLSISGVEGPKENGDCYGSCGQIEQDLRAEEIHPAQGWSRERIDQFLDVWRQWHLNDMRAGCTHQTALGWKHCRGHYDQDRVETCSSPKRPASPEEVQRALEEAQRTGVGLVRGQGSYYRCSEDKVGKPCPVCGYAYGSAWLKEKVPGKVLDFLRSLPDTHMEPAWV